MSTRKTFVVGSKVRDKATGEGGTIVDIKFNPQYAAVKCKVTWDQRKTTTWVKAKDVST